VTWQGRAGQGRWGWADVKGVGEGGIYREAEKKWREGGQCILLCLSLCLSPLSLGTGPSDARTHAPHHTTYHFLHILQRVLLHIFQPIAAGAHHEPHKSPQCDFQHHPDEECSARPGGGGAERIPCRGLEVHIPFYCQALSELQAKVKMSRWASAILQEDFNWLHSEGTLQLAYRIPIHLQSARACTTSNSTDVDDETGETTC